MATACWAPTHQLFLFPDGAVRSCCISTLQLGNIQTETLSQIWEGERRRAAVEALGRHDYGVGCESCGAEVELEGRVGSYPEQFDDLATHTDGVDGSGPWPAVMAFYLSNTCNLQCVQCNGENSSAIRIHREGRPPLLNPYDDDFFDDLRAFIPHLRHASFAGGEPFLAAEAFRVWELIAELNPGIPSSVCTNGTQWNERVERVLDHHPVHLTVSIDGATKETFERIRVGARFDQVVENLERFRDYTVRRGTSLTINHCLMVENVHEFPEMLRFAEDRGVHLDVSVVRAPAENSLTDLPTHRLAEIIDDLESREPDILHDLELNSRTWKLEMDRLRAWAAADPQHLIRLTGPTSRQILGLRRRADSPVDVAVVRAEVAEFSDDGRVHELVVGAAERVEVVSAQFSELIGGDGQDLVGRPATDVQRTIAAGFGTAGVWTSHPLSESQSETVARFPNRQLLIRTVALRDDAGWADHVVVLIGARVV